ncbi:MAG: hypothetical protein D6736_18980, partial [Nitrospinota bacterium]
EEGSGPGFWAIGVPGVQSNLNASAQDQPTEPVTSSRQEETINYELSKVVSRVVVPSGEIKHLSVAVLIDGSYQPGGKDGARKYVPRSAEEMEKYREIVKSAVGYNAQRGDRVEVANVPFEPQGDLGELVAKEARWAFWMSVSRYIAYIILAFFFFLFVVRPLIRRFTGEQEPLELETQLPRTVSELEADLGAPDMLTEGIEEEVTEHKPQTPRERVAEFVSAEPERAAELVRLWLKGRA